MSWKKEELALLQELRAGFLAEESTKADYWTDPRSLDLYHQTFAQRISWKWKAVLTEVADLGWKPPQKSALYDWGTGTGIAAQTFLAHWGKNSFESVNLWDRSSPALDFAVEETEKIAPITSWDGSVPARTGYVLLLSHVLGELEESALEKVRNLISKAGAVFWVEPGTPALSRRLIQEREEWKKSFQILGPCPHADACGLLAPENSRHWCHHFAAPPNFVFSDGAWSVFSKTLKIDLRSLPVSFLALTRGAGSSINKSGRVIGRPRIHKADAKLLVCRNSGVQEETVLKRSSTEAFKQLKSTQFVRRME